MSTSVPSAVGGCFGPKLVHQFDRAARVSTSRVTFFRANTKFQVRSQKNDVLRAIIKTGRDGLEAATKYATRLVPEYVPRPIARTIVAVLGVMAASSVLNSLLSLATFTLGIGATAYAAYIYFSRFS